LLTFFQCELLERRSCRACRAAAVYEPAKERAARIHQACAEPFACERFKLVSRSPGPVADNEYLNLIVSDPHHLDRRSGMLLPVSINQVDGAGVSVLRDSATNEEFDATFVLLKRSSDAKGRERYFHGVCKFLAGAVRWDNGVRHVGVYDTALSDRIHHADMLAPPTSRKEQEARKKRLIYKIGPSLIGVIEFRRGAFMKYARDNEARA
jgi:hypothetical protein